MENKPPPFWLPDGSVRALIVFVMVAITGYLLVTGQTIPAEWWGLVGTAIGFYIGVRANEMAARINGK